MKKADMILRSSAIFTGLSKEPISGFVAVSGNKILAVGSNNEEEYHSEETRIIDLGDQLICPGFVDVHCFFTGYLLTIAGRDFSHCTCAEQVFNEVTQYAAELGDNVTVIGRGLRSGLTELTSQKLDEVYGNRPVILFIGDGECCYMNTAALKEYEFTPDTCWSESYWRLLKYILNQRDFSVPEFKKYLSFMNSRGITSVKEMGFDDFYGFTEVLEELEKKGELTARVHFMSQPVGSSFNLEYGRRMRDKFHSDYVCFSGYNQMTDGSISQMEGDMKQPYLKENTCCKADIDWAALKADALKADEESFRFSLHAQGDAAIAKTIDIYENCKKDVNGKLVNRHAITDLECSDPADLERMGKMGIIAEVYPQIMSIADRAGKVAMIEEMIGMERGQNYWNRRKMADSQVVLSCGTDLPLLYDDIPESIYHTVGGQFPEGGEPFNPENTLETWELLKAWTWGGQYNLGREDILGTLEAGKTADIAVLDKNVFTESMEHMRDVKVSLTMVDGKIVYKK